MRATGSIPRSSVQTVLSFAVKSYHDLELVIKQLEPYKNWGQGPSATGCGSLVFCFSGEAGQHPRSSAVYWHFWDSQFLEEGLKKIYSLPVWGQCPSLGASGYYMLFTCSWSQEQTLPDLSQGTEIMFHVGLFQKGINNLDELCWPVPTSANPDM